MSLLVYLRLYSYSHIRYSALLISVDCVFGIVEDVAADCSCGGGCFTHGSDM